MERIGNVITTPTWATMAREEKRRIEIWEKMKRKYRQIIKKVSK